MTDRLTDMIKATAVMIVAAFALIGGIWVVIVGLRVLGGE